MPSPSARGKMHFGFMEESPEVTPNGGNARQGDLPAAVWAGRSLSPVSGLLKTVGGFFSSGCNFGSSTCEISDVPCCLETSEALSHNSLNPKRRLQVWSIQKEKSNSQSCELSSAVLEGELLGEGRSALILRLLLPSGRCPSSLQGVGLDGLWRFLPTQTVLWFYDLLFRMYDVKQITFLLLAVFCGLFLV